MDYRFGNFKLTSPTPLAVESGNLPKETAVAATTGQIAIGNFTWRTSRRTSAEAG